MRRMLPPKKPVRSTKVAKHEYRVPIPENIFTATMHRDHITIYLITPNNSITFVDMTRTEAAVAMNCGFISLPMTSMFVQPIANC